MKFSLKRSGIFCIILIFCLLMSGCSKVDNEFNTESKNESSSAKDSSSSSKTTVDPDYEHPTIMSDDRVMSKFIDISLYDEENYANVYLGKNFKISASYDGTTFKLPMSYNTIKESGFSMSQQDDYDSESLIKAGETIKTEFINSQGKEITAFFYNSTSSSVKLKNCNIVKLKIEGNNLFETDDKDSYGNFNVNGITNSLVITDIIDILGTPSHFYHEGDNEYYLDYFISEDDRRNGITVYVDIDDDSITGIEFSSYN